MSGLPAAQLLPPCPAPSSLPITVGCEFLELAAVLQPLPSSSVLDTVKWTSLRHGKGYGRLSVPYLKCLVPGVFWISEFFQILEYLHVYNVMLWRTRLNIHLCFLGPFVELLLNVILAP